MTWNSIGVQPFLNNGITFSKNIFAHFWVTLGKIIKCHGEIMTFKHSTHLVFIIMFY